MKNTVKPIIGIDGNEANVENRVGVNTYAYEVLNSIAKLEDDWSTRARVVVYLRSKPLNHMPPETQHFSYKVLHGGGQWILRTLTPHLFMSSTRPRVFWSPSHYIPPVAPMSRVCSIMDLGYLEFSSQFKKYDFWQLKLWSAWSIKNARKVLSISEATRKDIIKHYPGSREKLTTTLLGYDHTIYNTHINPTAIETVKRTYSIGQQYLLFMSTLKPSKNVEGLLRAWARIEKDYPKVTLVIAGKKGWLFEQIFSLTEKLSLEERVVFTDFVRENEKPPLIAGATAFVLPSFWEGFGLDVVSAMACGVPVVISDRGSLPEVAGKAGIVVNPDDDRSIAQGIEKILTASSGEYKERVKMGLHEAKRFNWDNTARETIKVLLSLL